MTAKLETELGSSDNLGKPLNESLTAQKMQLVSQETVTSIINFIELYRRQRIRMISLLARESVVEQNKAESIKHNVLTAFASWLQSQGYQIEQTTEAIVVELPEGQLILGSKIKLPKP